ncbi:MAG: hypothetical protein V7L01_25380 [Nostoc sp.]|uniref:hypothetical protein n=1 Tax=Nostoc sp. TaxID=1180 RepID=UPI002FFA6DF9
MSQTFEMDDDLCPEYDFTQLPVIAQGQGRKRSTLTVQLDPDRCSSNFSRFWGS